MSKLNADGRPRDTQRGKLYKAERKAAAMTPGKPLATVRDIERFIRDRVSQRATLTRRYGLAVDFEAWPVKVTDGRGCRSALAYETYQIAIPLWARNEWIVLHELAHIIHKRLGYRTYRGKPMGGERTEELRGGAAHGWQYAAVFIDLVQFLMGAAHADALKAEFKAAKVRFRPKQVRVMPPGFVPFKKKLPVTDETAMAAIEGRRIAA